MLGRYHFIRNLALASVAVVALAVAALIAIDYGAAVIVVLGGFALIALGLPLAAIYEEERDLPFNRRR
jgi:protein-S-isoprenylcysteine O-methyltransferase Ste14